jgi:phage antirepressor YoqD-like protein
MQCVNDLLLVLVGAVMFLLGIGAEKFAHWLYDKEIEIDLTRQGQRLRIKLRGTIV